MNDGGNSLGCPGAVVILHVEDEDEDEFDNERIFKDELRPKLFTIRDR
jgi:hypothetical protein